MGVTNVQALDSDDPVKVKRARANVKGQITMTLKSLKLKLKAENIRGNDAFVKTAEKKLSDQFEMFQKLHKRLLAVWEVDSDREEEKAEREAWMESLKEVEARVLEVQSQVKKFNEKPNRRHPISGPALVVAPPAPSVARAPSASPKQSFRRSRRFRAGSTSTAIPDEISSEECKANESELCTTCVKESSRTDLLEEHLNNSKAHLHKLSCSLEACNLTFSEKSYLTEHKKLHSDSREIRCNACMLTFSSLSSLQLHRNITNCGEKIGNPPTPILPEPAADKSINIETEGQTLLSQDKDKYPLEATEAQCNSNGREDEESPAVSIEAEDHSSHDVQESRRSCDYPGCDAAYSSPVLLRNHMYRHTESPFLCPEQDCGESYCQLENFLQHCDTLHSGTTGLLGCGKCEKVFSLADHLEEHLERSHEDSTDDLLQDQAEEISCKFPFCESSFLTWSGRRDHYLDHNNTAPGPVSHRCLHCGLSFPGAVLLGVHLAAVHYGASCPVPGCRVPPTRHTRHTHQPVQCDWPDCGAELADQGAGLLHLLHHCSPAQLVLCPVPGCPAICTNRARLAHHLAQAHQGEEWYHCSDCNYRAFNTRQLEAHLESEYHSARPRAGQLVVEQSVHCRLCPDLSFPRAEDFISHIHSHYPTRSALDDSSSSLDMSRVGQNYRSVEEAAADNAASAFTPVLEISLSPSNSLEEAPILDMDMGKVESLNTVCNDMELPLASSRRKDVLKFRDSKRKFDQLKDENGNSLKVSVRNQNFIIDKSMLANTIVPEKLQQLTHEDGSVPRELVLHLLQLQQRSHVSEEQLVQYILQLLPPSPTCRPASITADQVTTATDYMHRMSLQAARFRTVARQFPQLLSDYLSGPCNPFLSDDV